MGRSTVHYADNETNNILKRLHNKLRPAGTPVERVEYIIELLLLRIFETKLKQDDIFKPLRKLFEGENYRLLFSYLFTISNGDRILAELNKNIFPFYAVILQEARKVVKGNLPPKMQDQLVLMEEVFTNSNFTNNVKGGVITEVIGLINEIEEKYILKTDLLGDAIESALSETGGNKDLGLYRTPGHIRQMMVAMIEPNITDSIFDPACGTAGFLFDAYEYVIDQIRKDSSKMPSSYIRNTFYRTGIGGIEYQGRIRKMAAVNMYIRGLNPHNIMQGDSLKMYDPAHDANSKTVVIANPPFGAERDQPAYPNVWEDYSKESETTILFVKLMFDYLKTGGRCAVVVSEGFLTWGQGSACALRKMLLDEANLRAIISLPQGVFVSKNGQGAKTSILYFEKGEPTDFVWYYKIENDGFSMGTNRKPIEGSQIPELLKLFKTVKKGKKPKETKNSFCIDRKLIENIDDSIIDRIKKETREKIQKKETEKGKNLAGEKLKQFKELLEIKIESETLKEIEKAHTYHFNLQNYRAVDDEKHTEYPLVKLEELITPKFDKIQKDNFQGEFDVIDKISFSDGKIHLRKNRETGMDLYKSEQDDLITSKINVHQGAVALSPKVLVCSTHYQIYSINKSKINPLYLILMLRTAKFLEIVNLAKAGGIKNEVGANFLSKLQIPLPPIEIQNEIVEKIEKQKQIIEGVEKIEENFGIETDIFENSEWENVSMSEICKFSGGSQPPKTDFIYEEKEDYVRLIQIRDFKSDNYRTYVKKDDVTKFFTKDDIMIARYGPPVFQILRGLEGAYNVALMKAIPNEAKISKDYLFYFLQNKKIQKYIIDASQRTAGQSGVDMDHLNSYKIFLPPLSVQQQIVEKLDKQIATLKSVRFLKTEAEKQIDEILTEMWKEKPTNENIVEDKPFLKRKTLATYIINQSLNDINFGDVKFEKLLYLSEYFAIKRNFGQKYYVQAAGPYDNIFTREYFKQIDQSKWFKRQKKDNRYIFTAGEKHDKSLNTYGMFSEDELKKVNVLLNIFKKSDYRVPEVVSTLYAVWNNRIILQKEISDEILIQDFYDWDKHKSVYTKDDVENSLKWMKKNGIVPDGWGKVIEKANKKVK